MNWIDKIMRTLRNRFRKSTRTTDLDHLYEFLGIDRNLDSEALSEATYFACMKILSESLGKMPLKLLRYTEKNGVETMRKHPYYSILHDRPNPHMSATTFWSTVEFNRNHFGNAFVWIRGFGEDMSLWILPNNSVEILYDNAKSLADQEDVYYLYNSGSKRYIFSSEEILHFKSFNTTDGLVGVSVRDQLKNTIGGSLSSQKMLNKMYESGFTAKAVLNYTGDLNDANIKKLVASIENYAKGNLKKSGIENIVPIPIGFNLTPLNIKLADNQFIEVKQYTAGQIAAAFGIKPYQYNDLTKSSYASAEAQQLSFYVDTLLYIIKQYEEELSYKLLAPEELQNGYYFRFNVAVILRTDLEKQINTLATAVSNFIYTPNEARAYLDMEAKPGGDRLIGNGSTIPLEMTGIQYQKEGSEANE